MQPWMTGTELRFKFQRPNTSVWIGATNKQMLYGSCAEELQPDVNARWIAAVSDRIGVLASQLRMCFSRGSKPYEADNERDNKRADRSWKPDGSPTIYAEGFQPHLSKGHAARPDGQTLRAATGRDVGLSETRPPSARAKQYRRNGNRYNPAASEPREAEPLPARSGEANDP